MAGLCNSSQFLYGEQTQNSSHPPISVCFRHTFLTLPPCVWLWVGACVYLVTSRGREWVPIRGRGVLISKLVFAIALCCVTAAKLVTSWNDLDTPPLVVTTVAHSIEIATMILYAVLVVIQNRRAEIRSYVVYVYWSLEFLCGVITCILTFKQADEVTNTLTGVDLILVTAEMALHSIKDQPYERLTESTKSPCPYNDASVPSVLSFFWVTPMVVHGYRHQLTSDDLWDVPDNHKSCVIGQNFRGAWQRQLYAKGLTQSPDDAAGRGSLILNGDVITQKAITPPKDTSPILPHKEDKQKHTMGTKSPLPSLLRCIIRVFGWDILKSQVCQLFVDFIAFSFPWLLQLLVMYVQSPEEAPLKGYLLAMAYFILAVTQSVLHHQCLFISKRVGLRIKVAIMDLVYRKSLSVGSQGSGNAGEVINLLTEDSEHFFDLALDLFRVWSAPLRAVIACACLYAIVGPSVFAGFIVFLVVMPFNALMMRFETKFEDRHMALKDQRLRLTNEIITGIKVLKLYGWEPQFEKRLQEVRQKELKVLRNIFITFTMGDFTASLSPFLVSLVIFAVYSHTSGVYLSASIAFSVNILVNIVGDAVMDFPDVLAQIARVRVSIRRLTAYLTLTDLDPDNVQPCSNADDAIHIKDATFHWDKTLDPTLSRVNMEVKTGQLVAVVGKVGAGKSSLMAAILGLMHKLSGSVQVTGKVAYIPQEAWIQNATIRDNILFHNEMDAERYDLVLDACALNADLDVMPAGDLTEIGEKGINLSGGQKQRVSIARAVYAQADCYIFDDPLSAVDAHVASHIFEHVISNTGLLKGKTRILVTSGLQWLPHTDNIFVIANRTVSESGTYDQLVSSGGQFSLFLTSYFITNQAHLDNADNEEKEHSDYLSTSSYRSCTNSESEDILTHSHHRLKRNGSKASLKSRDSIRRRHKSGEIIGHFERSNDPSYSDTWCRSKHDLDSSRRKYDSDATSRPKHDLEFCRRQYDSDAPNQPKWNSKTLRYPRTTERLQDTEMLNTFKADLESYHRQYDSDASNQAKRDSKTLRYPRTTSETLQDTELNTFKGDTQFHTSEKQIHDNDDDSLHHVRLNSESNSSEKHRHNSETNTSHNLRLNSESGGSHKMWFELDNVDEKSEASETEEFDLGRLIEEEEVDTGQVKWSVYGTYIRSAGRLLPPFVVLFMLLAKLSKIGSGIWLQHWTDNEDMAYMAAMSNRSVGGIGNDVYLGVYGGFAVLRFIFFGLYGMFVAFTMVRASTTLHHRLASRVIRAPMAFFDVTPMGRILNRFSRDVHDVDDKLPGELDDWLNDVCMLLTTLIVISYSLPLFLTVALPALLLYYFLQRLDLATSRQLKRLGATTTSPILCHLNETITGVAVIRAHGLQKDFINKFEGKVDENQLFMFYSAAVGKWLSFLLSCIGNTCILAVALFAVSQKGFITGGLVGLAIQYALEAYVTSTYTLYQQITNTLAWFTTVNSDIESSMVSVERVVEYSNIDQEAPWIIDTHRPPDNWPDMGHIEFSGYMTRYRDDLDLVLKDISVTIKSGEKVGVVGRTGAGKSSLSLALFRIIEASEGAISIDGVDISTLGLHDLRHRMTILPQDPVIFAGTIRSNLDPHSVHSDLDLWSVLEQAHIKAHIMSLPSGLGHECTDGGQNLSVGQRQLLCLARALLRKSQILLLDEATASLDLDTDHLIQETISDAFSHATVLCIAHRLSSVIDYDKILVLDEGRIAEFGRPADLLADVNSVFYAMAARQNVR